MQFISGSKGKRTRKGMFCQHELGWWKLWNIGLLFNTWFYDSFPHNVPFFGRGRKTFGGNSLWMFPLDQLSKCLANQWENRKCRVFDGADQTTSDSGLIVLSFCGGSRFFPTRWNFSIIGCDSDGVAKKSIGTPNDIHVRFKVDIGQPSTILHFDFQDLQRQNVPWMCFFWLSLHPNGKRVARGEVGVEWCHPKQS